MYCTYNIIFFLTSGVLSFISGMYCFLQLLLLLIFSVSQQNTSNPNPAKPTQLASKLYCFQQHQSPKIIVQAPACLGTPQKGDVPGALQVTPGHLSSLQVTPTHGTRVFYAGCQAWQRWRQDLCCPCFPGVGVGRLQPQPGQGGSWEHIPERAFANHPVRSHRMVWVGMMPFSWS